MPYYKVTGNHDAAEYGVGVIVEEILPVRTKAVMAKRKPRNRKRPERDVIVRTELDAVTNVREATRIAKEDGAFYMGRVYNKTQLDAFVAESFAVFSSQSPQGETLPMFFSAKGLKTVIVDALLQGYTFRVDAPGGEHLSLEQAMEAAGVTKEELQSTYEAFVENVRSARTADTKNTATAKDGV